MSLDFTKKGGADKQPPRKPTNFSAPGVKIKLFIGVAIAMICLMFITRFRDPDFRRMIGLEEQKFAGGPAATKSELAHRKIDTGLRSRSNDNLGEPLAALVIEGADKKKSDQELDLVGQAKAKLEDGGENPLNHAWFDGWSSIVQSLNAEEKNVLFKGLKLAREGKSLEGDDRGIWGLVIEKTELQWTEYRERAKKSLDTLPEEERKSWTDVVQQLETGWNDLLKPAFNAIEKGQPVAEKSVQPLEQLQKYLDQIVLASVEDNSILRPGETEAWFRLFETLQKTEPADLRKHSTGFVGFLQLFDQPKEFRGKLVTIRGIIHRAYHVVAPKNVCGIEGYYVYWVRPLGRQDSPFVVYALETPPGFPHVYDKDKESEKLSAAPRLHEEAEFTGYFFKNWAYPAKDTTRLAPLLLARSPKWEPSPIDLQKPTDLTTIIFIVGGCGIAAVIFAFYAYKQSLKEGPYVKGGSFTEGLNQGKKKK